MRSRFPSALTRRRFLAASAAHEPGLGDRSDQGLAYRLVDLADDPVPLRERPPDWPVALAPDPLPEPDLEMAERHEVVFTGGLIGVIRVA